MKNILLILRRDLRIEDNPALYNAAKDGNFILPLYVIDKSHDIYSNSYKWLIKSLNTLNSSLKGRLLVVKGELLEVLPSLISMHNIDSVYWNKDYSENREQIDLKLTHKLKSIDVDVVIFDHSFLWHQPKNLLTHTGKIYKVFTQFFNRCLTYTPRKLFPKPGEIKLINSNIQSQLPSVFNDSILDKWNIGEMCAQEKLNNFIQNNLCGYKIGRNYPFQRNVSYLSPHLHFGEISPHQIWHKLRLFTVSELDLLCFYSELTWREFSQYNLYHFPSIAFETFAYPNFPWIDDDNLLNAWKIGHTGFPFVDAGMRELINTGYMHNRTRMITASFLTKILGIDWRLGAQWFEKHLMDADVASNSYGWQWVVGSTPNYDRFYKNFNPMTQSEKCDPEGRYIYQYIPELQSIPPQYIHAPWTAPQHLMQEVYHNIHNPYPKPIVDYNTRRRENAEIFKSLLKSNNL